MHLFVRGHVCACVYGLSSALYVHMCVCMSYQCQLCATDGTTLIDGKSLPDVYFSKSVALLGEAYVSHAIPASTARKNVNIIIIQVYTYSICM